MARFRIVHWKDIPSVVEAADDERTVRHLLSPKFQDLIDSLAMRDSATEEEAYLAGCGGGRRERLPDPPHAAIPAQAELASSPTRIASVSPSAYNRGGPMKARELLAACFFLFGALLIWPLLTIANRPVLVGGVPALVVYLFAVWAIIVSVLIAVAIRRRAPEDDE